MRLGLFGGSFDPIHRGHLHIARAVAKRCVADRVLFLPSRTPPHKPGGPVASAEHRLAMVQAAIAGDPLFECSDYDLTCVGPSYTAHTVAHFHAKLPDAELIWIIGADSLRELHTWYQPDEIVRHARIVTAVRPGYAVGPLAELERILPADTVAQIRRDVLDTPEMDISSSEIRRRIAAGESTREFVPEAVADYIATHCLYRGSAP